MEMDVRKILFHILLIIKYEIHLAWSPWLTIESQTPDMPGRARMELMTGTQRRKLIAIGKNPPNNVTKP